MDLELSQKQGLTPAMQTSIHLLQMNNLQLRAYLGELMTSNALVELEYPDIDCQPGPFDRQERLHAAPERDAGASAVPKEQLMEDRSAAVDALRDLFLQSTALRLPAQQHRILHYIIRSLDENGFFTESPESAARVLGVSVQQVQTCLRLLQAMEPAGVGAADLRDCLRLQLQREAQPDPAALAIVQQHLELLARQQYGAIAKALRLSKAQVLRACEHIRSLNPRPLNGLGGEVMTQYILPDFYVIEDAGQLRCIMNDSYLPRVRIDPACAALLRDRSLSPADSEYLQKNYRQACDVIKYLAYRKSTMQRVVERILVIQEDFFRQGPGHRAAMGNAEIAQALGLHESTVSRAASGKFFECKWGVFPLKSLFVRSS